MHSTVPWAVSTLIGCQFTTQWCGGGPLGSESKGDLGGSLCIGPHESVKQVEGFRASLTLMIAIRALRTVISANDGGAGLVRTRHT